MGSLSNNLFAREMENRKCLVIRIYAEPFAYNIASCRVLEKAGFQYEGTLRSNAVKNGKDIDMKMYSLLKTEV